MPMQMMTDVVGCAAKDCAFNKAGTCRAMGITVGNGSGAACDTFMPRSGKASADCAPGAGAGVGACKMSDCRFNDCLQCGAESVRVVAGARGASCGTYARA